MSNKMQHNKKALISALEKTLGVVTDACEIVKINRVTYYRYYNDDEDFKRQVDSIQDIALDFAESKLNEQIDSGNITAIIFYLKTKGKKRGYIEKQEIEMKSESTIEYKNVSKQFPDE